MSKTKIKAYKGWISNYDAVMHIPLRLINIKLVDDKPITIVEIHKHLTNQELEQIKKVIK